MVEASVGTPSHPYFIMSCPQRPLWSLAILAAPWDSLQTVAMCCPAHLWQLCSCSTSIRPVRIGQKLNFTWSLFIHCYKHSFIKPHWDATLVATQTRSAIFKLFPSHDTLTKLSRHTILLFTTDKAHHTTGSELKFSSCPTNSQTPAEHLRTICGTPVCPSRGWKLLVCSLLVRQFNNDAGYRKHFFNTCMQKAHKTSVPWLLWYIVGAAFRWTRICGKFTSIVYSLEDKNKLAIRKQ